MFTALSSLLCIVLCFADQIHPGCKTIAVNQLSSAADSAFVASPVVINKTLEKYKRIGYDLNWDKVHEKDFSRNKSDLAKKSFLSVYASKSHDFLEFQNKQTKTNKKPNY